MGHPLREGSLAKGLVLRDLAHQRPIVRGKNKLSPGIGKKQLHRAGDVNHGGIEAGENLRDSGSIPGQEGFLQGDIRLQEFNPLPQLPRFRRKQGLEQLLPAKRLIMQMLIGILLLDPPHPIQRGGKAENKGEGQGKNQRQGDTFSIFPHFSHGILCIDNGIVGRASEIIPGVFP